MMMRFFSTTSTKDRGSYEELPEYEIVAGPHHNAEEHHQQRDNDSSWLLEGKSNTTTTNDKKTSRHKHYYRSWWMLPLLVIAGGSFYYYNLFIYDLDPGIIEHEQPVDNDNQDEPVHHETIPTLLSVVDPESNEYLYSLDNELYEQLTTKLKNDMMNMNDDNNNVIVTQMMEANDYDDDDQITTTIQEYPELHATLIANNDNNDNDSMMMSSSSSSSLTVTWTDGLLLRKRRRQWDEDESVVVVRSDTTILLLVCGSNSSNSNDDNDGDNSSNSSSNYSDNNGPILLLMDDSTTTTGQQQQQGRSRKMRRMRIYEAATVSQALATSALVHRGSASTEEEIATSSDSDHDHNHHENEWYIPNFPLIREEVCQFVMIDDYYTSILMQQIHKRQQQQQQEPPHQSLLQLLAVSELFHPMSSMNSPTAIHMAFTNDPSEMVVNFVTGAAGNSRDDDDIRGGGADNAVPVACIIDPTDDSDTVLATYDGTSDTYAASQMCQSPANVTAPGKFQSPGLLHTVLLKGLKTNTTYKYKVGLKTGQGVTFSDIYQFQSAPHHPVDDDDSTNNHTLGEVEPFSFLVYGDQGCPSKGWEQGRKWTAAMAAREIDIPRKNQQQQQNGSLDDEQQQQPIRMVHHLGDLSYAQGAAHIWDEWFAMIQVISTKVPLMIAVGNHEYDHTSGGENKDPSGVKTSHGFMPTWGNFGDDSGGECGVPASKRFTMPKSNTSNGVFWYSYDYANVHTTVISSEHDLSHGSPQHTWLKNDLMAVNRTRTPWLIVESHRPLYEAEAKWDQNNVAIGMRYEFEDLLHDYKVDLFLAGHYHAYHRTCDGLYRSKCSNGGPTHITIGSAGAHLDDEPLYDNKWTAQNIQHEYGYGRITVMNATALRFEFVKLDDEDGDSNSTPSVRDQVWITRRR